MKLALPGLPVGCVLSCYDFHPFNIFKNRNSELVIYLAVYFPIMLIVVKLNVAIKSQLILSLDFGEDCKYARVQLFQNLKMMHVL